MPGKGDEGKGGARAVEAYLAKVPPPFRPSLEKLRAQIRKAAPKASEGVSYGIPGFFQDGGVVWYAAFKSHLSFFPGSVVWSERYESKLAGYKRARGTIQFTPDRPIPADVVRAIVKERLKANAERAAARARRQAAKRKPAK